VPCLHVSIYLGLNHATAIEADGRDSRPSPGDFVLVGTRSWLQRHGVGITPELEGSATSLERQGKTVVFVAGGSKIKGLLAVADRARPEAREAVASLHR